ncbi:MAG: hypothetical protein M1840_002410 [Geoglossum simile]|nr:MAG: hypothetical protein M1840_002410 [Geoglossum simile]
MREAATEFRGISAELALALARLTPSTNYPPDAPTASPFDASTTPTPVAPAPTPASSITSITPTPVAPAPAPASSTHDRAPMLPELLLDGQTTGLESLKAKMGKYGVSETILRHTNSSLPAHELTAASSSTPPDGNPPSTLPLGRAARKDLKSE